MRLIVILFCSILSVVLMQASSLFLLDYSPLSQKAAQKIYQKKLLWEGCQISNHTNPVSRETTLQLIKKEEIDLRSPEFLWLKNHKNSEIFTAFNKLEDAKLALSQPNSDSQKENAMSVEVVVKAYDVLANALQRDLEIKQSVVALLQLICVLLIFSCLGAIAVGAKRLLVNRVDALMLFVPNDFVGWRNGDAADEFTELEQLIYTISARLKGYMSESHWFSETSSERLRRMVRAQEFLYTFVQSVNNAALTEAALRKGLYQLEKALNVQNVVLVFSENVGGVLTERTLYSDHKPDKLESSLYDELATVNFVKYISQNADGSSILCLAAGFTCPTGALGILRIEADKDRLFEETEIQLIEVTAELLSMIMGFQEREHEGRRVALLEERATIARELHDSLAQSLAYMKIQISRLQTTTSSKRSIASIEEIVSELRVGLDGAYRELRELLATFRVHIDVRGLGFALQAAIEEFTQRSNISISLDNRLIIVV